MAPQPAEQIGESTAGDAHKSLPTPFLTKTYQLVDDRVIDDVISWNDDGSSFIVWKPTEFARDLLPKYFKHNNFSSFVRQLNTYGFRKVVPDRWEFSNDCFKKGEKRLLRDIQRRKISTPPATPTVTVAAVHAAVSVPVPITVSPTNSGDEQVISSNSSPAAMPILCRNSSFNSTAELMDENERLRRENSQLSRELTQMKSLYNNIYVLMSNYANPPHDGGSPAAKPLDLLPTKPTSDDSEVTAGNRTKPDDDTCPRLFGVSIGVKRGLESEDTSAEHERSTRPREIKSEPLDHRVVDNDKASREMAWLKQC